LKDAIDNCRLKSGLNPLSGTNVPHRKTDSDTHLKKNSDTDQSVAPVGVRRSTHKSREIDFGTLVHKMLEIITAENQEVGKDELRRMVGLDFADFDLAWDVTFKILNSPQLQRFYKPTEFLKAQNEVAYVNIRGDVKRIDRLVHFNEEIWVLDYKISLNESSLLNASKRSQYKQQLAEYKSDLQAMKIIKPIRMGIVLSSGDLIEL
jgi:ATP-dependent helicase/nuclease subunit A